MLKSITTALAIVLVLSAQAATDPKNLVVFPEKLPDIQNLHTGEMQPVIRGDLLQPPEPGVLLIPAAESVTSCPQAVQLYPVPQSGTLHITVTDDPNSALATRLGHDRMLTTSFSFPGMPTAPKVGKHVFRSNGTGDITTYLSPSVDGSWSHMTMVIPDKNGADRFLVSISWVAASSRQEELTRDEKWLSQVAPLVDAAKLQTLP